MRSVPTTARYPKTERKPLWLALTTEWLGWVAISCELWRISTGHIVGWNPVTLLRTLCTNLCALCVWLRHIEHFTRVLRFAYRVGSANFSRRKIGHAHDYSADSENVAGVREPSVHAHFIFRFKNDQGNQSNFATHDQNTAETSQPQAQPTDGWRAIDRARPRGLQRPWEKFGSVRLSRKKGKFRG